ncbi:SDR family oxidoreductase [Kineosporia sp. NBRC 101731]|uniref:SDR family oxidoreductase n=1 Tax=Kineosporia sp. NBRC 101731 TaxID=3032199 RepID=UPI0024A4E2D9|nr:SDR family oxidoreductase [Kineosporia sp. NBRC 101731]GLY29256.1 short-chain dehydrogenase/reductase [Kineosporia sp. NBRC 101731]
MSTVLITGAATGFARLAVESLLDAGHTVAATMRDVTGRNQQAAGELAAQDVTVIELDVTDEDSVQRGVARAIAELGHIDVVVNNAGLGALDLLEGFTTEDLQKVFDVNVFGVHRVNRAIIPHMKARRSGLLVLISSLTSRLAIPFQGPYGASKAAAENFAELYRAELSQLGIESAIIEPGGMPTEFIGKLSGPSEPERLGDYGDVAALPAGFLQAFESTFAANPAQSPRLVADAIVDLINLPHGERPFRTVVDRMGLGDLVQPQNERMEALNQQLYDMFQISHLLTVKR